MFFRALGALLTTATVVLGVAGSAQAQVPEPPAPLKPVVDRGDRFVAKPVGTEEKLTLWFGPYVVPPGHDANRVDLELPVREAQLVSIEPEMRRVMDLSVPSHQTAHIHHAHWFGVKPGESTDNYYNPSGFDPNLPDMGMAEWVFGMGDEETKADFSERSAADPTGPVYGKFIGVDPQVVIFMLHNKTAEPLPVYISLDVTIIHGTKATLDAWDPQKRPHRDVKGVLFGRTYDVPRQPNGDGRHEYRKDTNRVVEWTSTISGTIIGMGGHVHPGGIEVIVENAGPKDNPCAKTAGAYDGTYLFTSKAIMHNVQFSEDYQMSVTNPAFRAPLHVGDRLRISATYENKDHGWIDVMEHLGTYVDTEEAPKEPHGRCEPYLLPSAPAGTDVHLGVPNREWGSHTAHESYCGEAPGSTGPCEKPAKPYAPGIATDTITIANFQYVPGDLNLSGAAGDPAQVKEGATLRFVNADQAAGIRHSITTCAWPCNGDYVANYPLHDGVYESGTLGYDPIDGGSPSPLAETSTLKQGKYSYFCRIHPWMRGAFEVVPA